VKATSSSPDDYFSQAPGRRISQAPAAAIALAAHWATGRRVIDVGWAVFALLNLIAIFWFPDWETIPFHFIWISLTALYGFRTWSSATTMWVLGAVMATTVFGIGLDVFRGTEPAQELTEVPLMAAVFAATVWHVRRRQAAEHKYQLISEENARMLNDQRQFVQDAAHQLRTPITIALGHAELLADSLGSRVDGHPHEARHGTRGHAEGLEQQQQDIRVVIGELNRLRRISRNLLLIAASSDPEFLQHEPVALGQLLSEAAERWRPTADRHWHVGRVDQVTLDADRDRLSLALDALLDNAVRHTAAGDVIELSLVRNEPGSPVRLIVADGGSGIPDDQQHLIFDRFRIGRDNRSRGTGLGLALVRAVARAHGGDVTVRSMLGEGSEFELTLPTPAD
jgi:two-component system OmpR family sensor kinase